MTPKPPSNRSRDARALILAAGVLLAHAGCASHLSILRPAFAAPAAAALDPPAPLAPLLAAPAAGPQPVYRNPKIGIVHLRAHQDAQGRLLGPEVMYQVVDPGGWNLEAVEGGEGFIPAINLEVPANAGSPYVVPAREVPPLPSDAPLVDPARAGQITITGLMRLEDRSEAEAMALRAGGGRTALFDDQAGWLLIPPIAAPHLLH